MTTMIETPILLAGPHLVPSSPSHVRPIDEACARRELRTQIARLERRVSEMVEVPRGAPLASGCRLRPRLLTLSQLERVRDGLVVELQRGRAFERAQDEERSRARLQLEEMVADPARHRFMRISAAAVGEPGCGVYQVRPRLGLIGMLAGWWEVKLSSGCP
jgi:hypothetical protein